jgi:RNA polymerase sigma-70 factor (ECF subfamily)
MSDLELVTRYRETHDPSHVGALYLRYSHLVYVISRGILKNEEDAQDAVMAVFEKLIKTLQEKEIANLKAWLATVTQNHCISHVRKQSFRAQYHQEVDDLEKLADVDVENGDSVRLYKGEESQSALQQALAQLSEAQRTCIELFYAADGKKSYKEIAQITGYTEKEVKSHLQNGKRNLKSLIARGS